MLITLFALGCEAPELPGTDVELTVDEQADVAEATQVEEPEPLAVDEHGVNEGAKAFTADSPEKGRKSKEAGGYLGAVAHKRFWAEHEMIRHSITHALNLFNATEGRYPKSHDEFMEKIVKFNQLTLPELPEGEEYIFDPNAKVDEMLKVQPIQ